MHGINQIKAMNGGSRRRLTEERVGNLREAEALARDEGLHLVKPMERVERSLLEGTDGIRAISLGGVQGKPAWHGEYRGLSDSGTWYKVRNVDEPLCYSTPEYALAAARLHRDEERVRYEAAFGQNHS